MDIGSHSLYRVIALGVIVTMAAPAWAAGQSRRHLPDLSIEELMGVSIEQVFGASERMQPVTEAPASVTIITADDISRYGYRTLADILRGVRGFYVSDDRNYSYIGVRGFGLPGDYNSRVLLLVNGHKVNDNIYDQAYIGAELGMDVATFDRVEIIRGPASSLYGTSAFFAVVNIITRSGGSMEGISLQAEAGTLGRQLGRGLFGRTFANGLDVALSGTYERGGGVERLYFEELDTPATNSGIADGLDGEELGTAYGRFRLHDFTLTTTLGRRLKDIPTASYSTLFNSQSPRARTTDSRTMVHGQYERVAGRTRFAADVSFDRLRYEGVYPYAGAEPGSPPLVLDDMSVGARWGIAGRATRALPGGQTLTAGGEFMAHVTQKQWLTYSDPMVPGRSIDKSSRQSGIYVQDEIRVRRWLLLNAGLRFDRYDRFARTTPRGAVIVVPSSNQSFKYLYGRAFRAPNAYELYYFVNAFTTLQPESIGTHELVWEQYVGEWLRTSVSGYRYAASRLIIADFRHGDEPIFFNSGEARAKGLEVEAEVRSRRGAQVLFGFATQRSEDAERGTLVNSPGEMAKLRLSAPGPLKGSLGAIEVQYLGARHTLGGAILPGATVAHATFSARITPAIELVSTARNLFNQAYADPASGEHAFDRIRQNGRTVRLGIRWTLWGARVMPSGGNPPLRSADDSHEN